MEDVRQELDLWCGVWVVFWEYETKLEDAIRVIAFMKAEFTSSYHDGERTVIGAYGQRGYEAE